MSYSEESLDSALHAMCLEPLRYGRMIMKQCKELNEPFKADIRNPKHTPEQFSIHVEAKDPELFLDVCANVVAALKNRGINPEVFFGDLPTMQESHDEGADTEKDS